MVTQHGLVFICAWEWSWESLKSGSSRAGGCEGGRFVVWGGFFWGGGVSDVSLRRRMKRRSVQRGREGLCLCLSRCVICSRLSKHLQSAGSPGMQRQGWGWEQQPWETAALLNLCRLVPPRAECQHRQCQRCVGLIVTGPVSSRTHTHTHTDAHTHPHTHTRSCSRHTAGLIASLADWHTLTDRGRSQRHPPSHTHTHTHMHARTHTHTHTHTHTYNCSFTQP